MTSTKIKAGASLVFAMVFALAVHKAEANVQWAPAGTWCKDTAVDGSTTIVGQSCAGSPNTQNCGGTFSVRVFCNGNNCASLHAPSRQIEGWGCPDQKIDSHCAHVLSNGQSALSNATPNYEYVNWAACQLTQY